MNSFKGWVLALVFILPLSAQAKRFQNAYVSFELPPNWNCDLEGTEWVCISQFSARSKEAIIILTAKQAGPADTFEAYTAHLKLPRNLPAKSGPPTISKVIHTQSRNIAGHAWVDGLHLGSEVSTYYTRYLGTIKEGIAILVTFSAHKAHYTKYSSDFLKAIESLRVVATKDLLNNRPSAGIRPGTETIGAPIGANIPQDSELPMEDSSGGKSDTYINMLIAALVLGAIGFYILMKRRKKNSNPMDKK